MRDSALGTTSLVLVIVGALNWGLVGLGGFLGSNWNVVELALGAGTLGTAVVENLVYVLVGIAGLYELSEAAKM